MVVPKPDTGWSWGRVAAVGPWMGGVSLVEEVGGRMMEGLTVVEA